MVSGHKNFPQIRGMYAWPAGNLISADSSESYSLIFSNGFPVLRVSSGDGLFSRQFIQQMVCQDGQYSP